MKNKKIIVGVTGSFCTFEKMFIQLNRLVEEEASVQTVFSANAASLNSRFGKGEDFLKLAEQITGKKPWLTIPQAEVIGPTGMFDLMIILPCTGNTMAKLAAGITDDAVLMAAKAHLRNEKPLLLSVSSNDAMGMNMKNLGLLMSSKNIYFVPFGQDSPIKKPNSLVASTEYLIPAARAALEGKQYQPVLVSVQ